MSDMTPQQIYSFVMTECGGDYELAAKKLKKEVEEVKEIFRNNGGCMTCG